MVIDAYFCGDYNHSFDTRIYPEGVKWVLSVLNNENTSWEFYHDGYILELEDGVLVHKIKEVVS